MTNIIFRKGELVNLRPLEKADITELTRWMNDPEVTQFLMRSFPLMEKEEEEWFNNLNKNQYNIVLGIVETKGNKLIGTIGLHSINWQHRTAVTGTYIGEKEYWGKGYGTEAKMLLLDLAFNAHDLHSILSRVIATNERSLNYGKKCGYQEVARIPKWIRTLNGKRCDEVQLIVTQERWKPLWKEYLKKRKLS